MPNLAYTSRKPLFWLVREGDRKEEYRRSSHIGDSDYFEKLSAAVEALADIVAEDISDHIPPHVEDLNLLKLLKQQIVFLQEHYWLVRKEDGE